MIKQPWIILAIVASLPYLAPLNRAWAKDTAQPPASDDRKAVGDDFRPLGPMPHTDHGPHGPHDKDRPSLSAADHPVGPHGPMPFDGPMPPQDPRGGGPPFGPGRLPGPGGPFEIPRFGTWESLEKNDPELYKLIQDDYNLERQSQELAMQCRQAPKDQQDEIKEKLEKVITQHFEARQQRRVLELKRLEEELKRLRELIDKRNESRQQIVNRRVSELLGLQDELRF
jgi:hypothetical protein